MIYLGTVAAIELTDSVVISQSGLTPQYIDDAITAGMDVPAGAYLFAFGVTLTYSITSTPPDCSRGLVTIWDTGTPHLMKMLSAKISGGETTSNETGGLGFSQGSPGTVADKLNVGGSNFGLLTSSLDVGDTLTVRWKQPVQYVEQAASGTLDKRFVVILAFRLGAGLIDFGEHAGGLPMSGSQGNFQKVVGVCTTSSWGNEGTPVGQPPGSIVGACVHSVAVIADEDALGFTLNGGWDQINFWDTSTGVRVRAFYTPRDNVSVAPGAYASQDFWSAHYNPVYPGLPSIATVKARIGQPE